MTANNSINDAAIANTETTNTQEEMNMPATANADAQSQNTTPTAKVKRPRTDYWARLDEFKQLYNTLHADRKAIVKEMGIKPATYNGYFNAMLQEMTGLRNGNSGTLTATKNGVSISTTKLFDLGLSEIFTPGENIYVTRVGNGFYVGMAEENGKVEISVTTKAETQMLETAEISSPDTTVESEVTEATQEMAKVA